MAFVLQRVLDVSICLCNQLGCVHQDKEHSVRAFHRQYRVCGEIGSGGFGRVFKAYRLADGLPVAVKSIRHKRINGWTLAERRMIPTEICFMEECQDVQGVVRLVGWFSSRRGFLIVMERPANFMDLFDLISTFGWLKERMARGLFSQIVATVVDLYKKHSVIHRDIKDENVVVDLNSGTTWLVDFGAAELLERAKRQRFQGTMSYSPPEVFQRDCYYPLEGTVWSLGILLYLLVVGKPPFRNELQICTGKLHFPRSVSPECRALVRRCLCPAPEGRISLDELQQNEWLLKQNTSKQGTTFCSEFESQWRRRQRQNGSLKTSGGLHAMAALSDDEDDDDCSYRTEPGTVPGPLTIPPTVLVTRVAVHRSTSASVAEHSATSSTSQSTGVDESAVLAGQNEQQNGMPELAAADTRSSASFSTSSLAMSEIGFETAPEGYDEWKENNSLASSNSDLCNGNDNALCQWNGTHGLQNAIPSPKKAILDPQSVIALCQQDFSAAAHCSVPLFAQSDQCSGVRCPQLDQGSVCCSFSSCYSYSSDREARHNSFASEYSFNSSTTYFSANSYDNLSFSSISANGTTTATTDSKIVEMERLNDVNDEEDETTLRTELPKSMAHRKRRGRGEMSEEDEWDETTIREQHIEPQSSKNRGESEEGEPFRQDEQLDDDELLAADDGDDDPLRTAHDFVGEDELLQEGAEQQQQQQLLLDPSMAKAGIMVGLSIAAARGDSVEVGDRWENSEGWHHPHQHPAQRRGGDRYRRRRTAAQAEEGEADGAAAGRRKRRLSSPPQQMHYCQ